MNENETRIILIPQGTLAEKNQGSWCRLGGILTPTGVGTEVEEGNQILEIGGKKYLIELPLFADFAL
jgi:acetate CoA/acetoacetate CoA-transferase alpha subunit